MQELSGTSEQAEAPRQQGAEEAPRSGQGAATALARLRLQREHRAREKPADEPTLAGRRNEGAR